MASYIIALREPNQSIHERIVAEFSHVFMYSNTLFLVTSDRDTEEISIVLGIKGEDRIANVSGFVAKLNGTYSGHTTPGLWTWLQDSVRRV